MSTRYALQLTPAARRELARLDRGVQKRLASAMESLADEPYPGGCRKLAALDGAWRIRVGDYRIVYQVEQGKLIVLVLRIAHRKDVYR